MNALLIHIHVKLLDEGIYDFDNALLRLEWLQNIYKYTASPTTDAPYSLLVYNMELSRFLFL